jgi:hypothetical protein
MTCLQLQHRLNRQVRRHSSVNRGRPSPMSRCRRTPDMAGWPAWLNQAPYCGAIGHSHIVATRMCDGRGKSGHAQYLTCRA